MFTLMVSAYTQRGFFCGEMARSQDKIEILEFKNNIESNINNLIHIKMNTCDGGTVVLNKIILETAVLEFYVGEEEPE